MRVNNLKVTDFRNIRKADVFPGPGMNFIRGANGQGKTNLVEAITFLSWLRSFRTPRSLDLISHDQKTAHLLGAVSGAQGDHEFEIGITRGFRRVTMDGNPVRSARECLSRFTVAFLSPDDPAILEGGPHGRRSLVDRFVILLDPELSGLQGTYSKLVRERNQILKDSRRPWDETVLDACEEALSEAGGRMILARKAALDRLLEHLPSILETLAGEDLSVAVSYSSQWLDGDCPRGRERIVLREHLASRRVADAALGRTTVGPHTDDLSVALQGHRARGRASRGQRKVLMLAWKAAEARVRGDDRGEVPVLVLDDALADLDEGRQGLVVEYLAAYPGQSFLTGTSAPDSCLRQGRVFCASDGQFHPEE